MFIKANGIKINCELSGKEEAPVVALSHSLACSMRMWMPQLERLEATFRVLRYDTRGHGMLDGLAISSVHWVGVSMGGMIGQGMALRHPDRLESLVLADTAAVIPAEAQPIWQQRIDTVAREGMAAVAESTLARWFTPNYLTRKPTEVNEIRRQILQTPVAGYIGCSEAIRRLDYLDQLAAVKAPTLILVGEDDPGTPVAASEAMHARIAGSKLVVIPVAAHLANIEQAEDFNTHLLKFLRRF
jgi:3-oxoadipate enol-lactonase